jgi:hypothetical protein
VQSVDPLLENDFQNVNSNFVENCSEPRKKFVGRPELLSMDAAVEMPKQEKSQGAWFEE